MLFFYIHLFFKVSKEDGLPQKLCEECARILQLIYTFRIQAEKAQEEFQKLLQNAIKTEPLEVTPKTENDDNYLHSFDDIDINHDDQKTEDIEENKFTCSKCNKTFLKEKKFLKHLQMHESPLQCTICNKPYHNQASLDKHLAKHNKDYLCLVCNMNFQTESQLFEHSTTEHNKIKIKLENEAQEILLQCPDCDLTFTKQRSLSMHRRRHKNKNNEFICDTCGKTFSMKHQLKRHVVLHSDVKPHVCTKCSKSYARKDQLVHHMHSHKDSKPYECSYCKKGNFLILSSVNHS